MISSSATKKETYQINDKKTEKSFLPTIKLRKKEKNSLTLKYDNGNGKGTIWIAGSMGNYKIEVYVYGSSDQKIIQWDSFSKNKSVERNYLYPPEPCS